ncbi:MAG: Fic family protein, partial [Chlamydiota bacterium]
KQGQQIIKLDLLSLELKLSEREKIALEYALNSQELTIQQFQLLCPETSKRTLQRELKNLIDLGLLQMVGSGNERHYLTTAVTSE